MVPPMRHAGLLACSEQEAPYHLPVGQEVRSEAKADGGGGIAGEIGEGLPVLWSTFLECDGAKISGKVDDGSRLRLAGIFRQPAEV